MSFERPVPAEVTPLAIGDAAEIAARRPPLFITGDWSFRLGDRSAPLSEATTPNDVSQLEGPRRDWLLLDHPGAVERWVGEIAGRCAHDLSTPYYAWCLRFDGRLFAIAQLRHERCQSGASRRWLNFAIPFEGWLFETDSQFHLAQRRWPAEPLGPIYPRLNEVAAKWIAEGIEAEALLQRFSDVGLDPLPSEDFFAARDVANLIGEACGCFRFDELGRAVQSGSNADTRRVLLRAVDSGLRRRREPPSGSRA